MLRQCRKKRGDFFLNKKGAFTSVNLQYAMTHTAGISLAMIGNIFITLFKN